MPGSKLLKGAAMVAGELLKAGTDLRGDGSGGYLGDGTGEKQLGDVLQQSGENIAINIVGGKASDKLGTTFSNKAAKSSKSDVVAATKNLNKAKNKAGTGYATSSDVYGKSQKLAGAQDKQNFVEIGNGIGLGTTSKAGRQVVTETSKLGASQVRTGTKKTFNWANPLQH